MLVNVQPSMPGSYLAPVFKSSKRSFPPQTIISLPVQTAVCDPRGGGGLIVLVAVQLSVPGVYLPPLLKYMTGSTPVAPPQMIISPPVHTAVCNDRPSGALLVLVAVQLFVPGLYLPPVFPSPPQTIISLPVHTAV